MEGRKYEIVNIISCNIFYHCLVLFSIQPTIIYYLPKINSQYLLLYYYKMLWKNLHIPKTNNLRKT